MKVILSNSEQENNHILLLALDTSCGASGADIPEECTITIPNGLTVSITKGKKKRVSLFSSLLKKAISYSDNIIKLIKVIGTLLLLLLPDN